MPRPRKSKRSRRGCERQERRESTLGRYFGARRRPRRAAPALGPAARGRGRGGWRAPRGRRPRGAGGGGGGGGGGGRGGPSGGGRVPLHRALRQARGDRAHGQD